MSWFGRSQPAAEFVPSATQADDLDLGISIRHGYRWRKKQVFRAKIATGQRQTILSCSGSQFGRPGGQVEQTDVKARILQAKQGFQETIRSNSAPPGFTSHTTRIAKAPQVYQQIAGLAMKIQGTGDARKPSGERFSVLAVGEPFSLEPPRYPDNQRLPPVVFITTGQNLP